MRALDNRAETPTSRLLVVGAFLLVTLVTTAAFAQAMTGHVASMHAPSADATVTDYAVTDDDRLEVTLRIHNPTMKEFELVSSSVRARVDGELVTVARRTMLDGTVPSGGTKNVTVRLDFRDGGEERFRSAESDRIGLEGRLNVRIVEERVLVTIDDEEASA